MMKHNLRKMLVSFLMLSSTCAFAQMSGTYTIGGSDADFPTFTDAYSAMVSQKVNGDITFNVNPGTYNESLHIETWDYAFTPNIYPHITINGNSATITSTNSTATIFLGTEEFLINGLVVKNTGVGAAIKLWCGYNTIKNSTFQAIGTSVIYIDAVDENIFQNNTIIGGDYGIYAVTSVFNKFYDNDISQFKKAGFYITGDNNYADRDGNELKRNYFYGIRPSSNSTDNYCAIDILFGHDYEIEDNEIVIHSSTSSNTYGIYVHSEEDNYNILAGNSINVWGGIGVRMMDSGASFTNNSILANGGKGIYIDGNATLTNNEVASYSDDCIYIGGNVTAINNSTFLYNSSIGSAFRATTGNKVVNNSFFNSSTNSSTCAIQLNSAITCDYNNFYSLSSRIGVYNNIVKTSMSTWRSATGKDSHSISANPLYSDPELVSMQINLSSPLVNKANASEMPAYDITGEARKYNAIGAWDPYPSSSWNTRSVRQRAYDIRKALCESMELQNELNEQNASDNNALTTEYSINYSAGLLNVISSAQEDAAYTLSVADLLTGEVRMQTSAVLVGGISQSIDLSALSQGYYVVRLVTTTDTYSWKIKR